MINGKLAKSFKSIIIYSYYYQTQKHINPFSRLNLLIVIHCENTSMELDIGARQRSTLKHGRHFISYRRTS